MKHWEDDVEAGSSHRGGGLGWLQRLARWRLTDRACRQHFRRPAAQHPAAALFDDDRHGVVPGAIQVFENGGGRDDRDLVLARTAAVDDADAEFFHTDL